MNGEDGVSISGSDWYVVETQPRRESLAKAQLERQNFSVFFPQFLKTRRHARRQDTVLTPLFPNYLFVMLSRDLHEWRPINGTYGVKSLVRGASGRPVPMPSTAINGILSRSQNGIMTKLMSEFTPGDTVKIINGPFADRMAQIERMDAADRIRVLIDILGGRSSISVPMSDVSPVK